jgi:hypothetical protein
MVDSMLLVDFEGELAARALAEVEGRRKGFAEAVFAKSDDARDRLSIEMHDLSASEIITGRVLGGLAAWW